MSDPLSGDGDGGLLEAAVAYAAAGIPVFRFTPRERVCSCGDPSCDAVAKHLRTANGLKDATADVQKVAAWWERSPDANIGIPTGEPSGYVVLDVDPHHGGNTSLEKIQRQHGRLKTGAC